MLLVLLFLTFSVLVANPRDLTTLHGVGWPIPLVVCWTAKREQKEEQVWQHTSPPHHAARIVNNINRRKYIYIYTYIEKNKGHGAYNEENVRSDGIASKGIHHMC